MYRQSALTIVCSWVKEFLSAKNRLTFSVPNVQFFIANRKEWSREDVGAAVSDQQMRSAGAPYPVDRYLVESRKKNDKINIIDDDLWNPEPALRPEDEIILRKLHDMLQSTADDLKLLSGELSKYHEQGVQIKTLAIPLDEEFNEKVHLQEIVKAKFYSNKLVDSNNCVLNTTQKDTTNRVLPSIIDQQSTRQNATSTSVKVNDISTLKNQPKKNLQISRTNVMEVNESPGNNQQTQNHVKLSVPKPSKCVATVAYNEFLHKYVQPSTVISPLKSLQIQEMPKINIRSELQLQKVLQLDILPESKETHNIQQSIQPNTLVLEMRHEPELKQNTNLTKFVENQYVTIAPNDRPTMRKISTMSAYESSESNNVSSDSHYKSQKQKQKISVTDGYCGAEQKCTQQTRTNSKGTSHSQIINYSIDHWKKRLNSMYGRPLKSKGNEINKKKESTKYCIKKQTQKVKTKEKNHQSQVKLDLNNTEYIPYSKLTLGGVKVSDVEKELSNEPKIKNAVLSPILDKILSRSENSIQNNNLTKNCKGKNSKILTTSDENLLQEVVDIEIKVAKTLSDNKNIKKTKDKIDNDCTKDFDSYADDFEDGKSDTSNQAEQSQSDTTQSSQNVPLDNSYQENDIRPDNATKNDNKRNKCKNNVFRMSCTKSPKLSLKNSVDIFEFIHSIDTHETGTQSNMPTKITPKETQTSPRENKTDLLPIYNDLTPIDSRKQIEKMLISEKEYLKKLIIDEYGDLLEKSLHKPSTSGKTENKNTEINAAAAQKITQTSPAHVKCAMTSPIRYVPQTTSPCALPITVNRQTSPINADLDDGELNHGLEEDGLGISANLSSPRFSLRLPETTRDVLAQFENKIKQFDNKNMKSPNLKKNVSSSSSAFDTDYSSSDISSLGEINKRYKLLKKSRMPSVSESSSSSSSKYTWDASGTILPLKSDGETSIMHIHRNRTKKHSRSEGEISFGQLH